ncbi:MAG: glycosyltransferase, partial [Anaerolineales bacterium]
SKILHPRILIVSDMPGWAYDHDSAAIILHLNRYFKFSKVHAVELPRINHRDFDLIYVMYWRSDFMDRNTIPKEKLIIQVSSFWSWQHTYPMSVEELVEDYLMRACAVSVNCPGLYDLISPLHPLVFLNPSGVDLTLFKPQPPKSTRSQEPLVVGWAGSTAVHGDNKGLLDLIIPACDSLKNVHIKIVTKEEQWLPHEQMPQFYRNIDVYLCASQSEGTPNPVLEAAASARAVVSSPVGIVPMLIKDGHNGLIIQRSIKSIQTALITLRDQRQLCLKMGHNSRDVIESEGWSWEYRAMNYKHMFGTLLDF